MHQRIPAIIILALLIIGAGCTGTAPETASRTTDYPDLKTPETSLELKEYVDTSAIWALENGREEAIAAFGDPSGPFVTDDIYVYALDYSGIALALPFQPEMVGEDFMPLLDASGKPYTEVEIKLAEGGGGYILYHYPYPAGDQPQKLKISYVRPVDDTYWIGAGVYTRDDLLITPKLRAFVDDAKAYALKNGRDVAIAAFNNEEGDFIDGDLYIFAYEYDGTVLAWPYRPDMIGVNRLNATDPFGSHHIQTFMERAKSGGGMVDYYSVNPFTNMTDLKISYLTDVDGTWMLGCGQYIEPGQIVLRT
ncbi:MAG: cache domain-containing protein [Methanocalculus sp.]|uniref:cache domain-containing protein n=1 Tax=Methanocalculus sp. TaxID=2004547 RepID=UPI00271A257C|nr:cache domain-containing protein [Methanocalculus sp.]MDO9539606.1 cache domain-containing protein [Methanocalculus sp.]